ncbi:MAG: HAD family hydrolase, partial [Jatrophihabitantaceae bacterium]
VLLVDGAPDRGWARQVARALSGSVPLQEVWTHVARACHPRFTAKLRNADGLFCYAVVRPHLLPDGFVAELAAWAASRGWRTSLQGRKLYWVPDRLSKSAAVHEVAGRVGADLVLAAGDSLLDVDLLLAADLSIRPRHGELDDRGWTAPTVTVTQSRGIAAGAEIVNWFGRAAAPAVRG